MRILFSGYISLITILFFFSCSKDQQEIVPTPPVPGNACSTLLKSGYTDKVSYHLNEKVVAYLQASQSVPLCRLSIYNVKGQLAFEVPSTLFVQTISNTTPSTNGFGYKSTVEFALPETLKSGIYLIENKVPFIVKTNKPVELLVLYPSNTANAYEGSGGSSFYKTAIYQKADKISFHRPIELQSFAASSLPWFYDRNNTIGYIADIDMDNYDNLKMAKILVVIGHSEYWTRVARQNFDRFVQSGGHALVLSGNTMWWQVRYEDKGTQLVCYKDKNTDPESDPLLKTITWAEDLLDYPIITSIGCDFPRGGYGLKSDQGWDGFKVVSGDSPLLKNTGLAEGSIISCPTSEYDGVPILRFNKKGFPVIDTEKLGFDKVELIAFDKGFRVIETYGTFIVFQKTSTSGIVINTASTDWCSSRGMGGKSGDVIKTITANAIDLLVSNKNPFSPKPPSASAGDNTIQMP